MTPKNIFTIARRGSADDEDQLTELLAYLFQEEPGALDAWLKSLGLDGEAWSWQTQSVIPGGRLDLVVEHDQAVVIVESKLGSSTDYLQCIKYIAWLRQVDAERRKVLVLVTKYDEPWPRGIPEFASDDVELRNLRWWDVATSLANHESSLASDLAAMLAQERMTIPPPVSREMSSDWSALAPTVHALLEEARPQLRKLSTRPTRQRLTGVENALYQSIHCFTYFERAQVVVGISATREDLERHRYFSASGTPVAGAVMAASVRDPLLSIEEQARAAKLATEGAGRNDVVGAAWGTWPTIAGSATDVLRAGEFRAQVDELVSFTREAVEHFRAVGFLRDEAPVRVGAESSVEAVIP